MDTKQSTIRAKILSATLLRQTRKRLLPPLLLLAIAAQIFALNSVYSQNFYPLGIGDVWQYRVFFQGDTVGYANVEIAQDSLMPNGKRYTFFNPSFSGGRFQRVDDSLRIFNYDANNIDLDTSTTEVLMDKLNATIGETWFGYRYADPGRPGYCIKEDQYITSWFGTEVTVIQIAYFTYDSTTAEPGFFLARIRYSSQFGIIYVAMEGGAAYELKGAKIDGVLHGTIVGVAKNRPDNPVDLEVLSACPNPFNSLTNISYSLPSTAYTKIMIFDALGRTLAVLVDEVQRAGEHCASWNAANIASGTYFCRIQFGTKFMKTIKITLIR